MKAALVILFITSSLAGLSQSGKITGRVTDASDNSGIEFATLTLFNASDSKMINGAVSAEDGSYQLAKVPWGTYHLRINFIGYTADTIKNISLSPDNPVVSLPEVGLHLSSALSEVDVVANRSAFETRIDKRIFNADQNLGAQGGTGLDLLRQVPSVIVDENENILLRGDGNVTILIDGRPSAMPVNQLMKQLPASAIERVELITNPSAKYDPEGMSGIINIVLKKNKLEGFNGNIQTNVGYSKFPKAGGTLGLNYRNEKINLSGTYSYNYSKTWFGGDLARDVLLDSVWDRLRSDDYGERVNHSHYGTIGLDYFINDYNTFYISGSYTAGANIGSRLVNYNSIDEAEVLLSHSRRRGDIDAPSGNMVFNTGWQKTFKKPSHTLDFDLNYASSTLNTNEYLSQRYYDQLGTNYINTYQHTAEDNDNTNFLAKLDYVVPLSDSMTLETGVHFTQRGANNAFFSESGLAENTYQPDTNLNNSFQYDQAVLAPYLTIARQFKRVGLKAGLRAENTLTTSELVNTGEQFENDYFKLFPSVHVSYKTTRNSEIQLSYSKRINRPQMAQLNPFTNFSDALTLQRGNPFLRPEIIHVNELTYIKFWQKINVTASVYYRVITDLIRRNLTYDGIFSTVSYQNLGHSNLYGGDLNITYTPSKKVRILSTTNCWNTTTTDQDITGGERQNYFGVHTALQGFFQMKKGWSAHVWGSYAAPMKVVQGIVAANYGGGFAIRKSILKRRGSLNLSFVDVFKTRRFAFDSYDLGNYTFNSTRRWESRSVYLTFSYSFGKLTQGKTKRTSSSGNINDDSGVPQLQ